MQPGAHPVQQELPTLCNTADVTMAATECCLWDDVASEGCGGTHAGCLQVVMPGDVAPHVTHAQLRSCS